MDLISLERIVLAAMMTLLLVSASVAQQQDKSVAFWLESSLKRVYPASPAGSNQTLTLLAPRNGQVSFQACMRNDSANLLNVECSVSGADGLNIQVRRVGYVPVSRLTTGVDQSEIEGLGMVPGLVPDPLFPEQKAAIGPYQNQSFWITVNVPKDAKPGNREMTVHYALGDGKQSSELKANLKVSEFVVNPRKDFPVIHWWRGEAIWDWYKTGMFEDERWWTITRNCIKDMISHGSDVVYVPIFFDRREVFKRPCQLLKVTEPQPGKYEFDFSDVSKFLKMARECGASSYEWSHFWIYWGARNPVRVYKWVDGRAVMLWSENEDGHGPVFHNFLKQFLPQFHAFLVKEGVLDKSYFHVSDEPGEGEHLANYKKARVFLDENAPWMHGKIIDALSSIQYGRQHLTDIPIPIISSAQAYIDEGIPHWVYFCCGPRGNYLQRLMDTPLPKIRMSGWLFYKLGAKGFLHWGYNYWHAMEQERIIDPFTESCGEDWPGIPPGDPFEVYPGKNGPIDSIRWEIFAESLQDYAILQTAGINPNDHMLAAIHSYAEFPKSEEWIDSTLERILK